MKWKHQRWQLCLLGRKWWHEFDPGMNPMVHICLIHVCFYVFWVVCMQAWLVELNVKDDHLFQSNVNKPGKADEQWITITLPRGYNAASLIMLQNIHKSYYYWIISSAGTSVSLFLSWKLPYSSRGNRGGQNGWKLCLIGFTTNNNWWL